MLFRELCVENPVEFKSVMRLTPEQFEELLFMVYPIIQRSDAVVREALSARIKLEILLTYLATGTNFRILSAFFRVSKSAICGILPEVCDAIKKVLEDHMKVSSVNVLLE
ncbi:hypothetical protein PR048_033344 [Dryococelus australis]|uniref:Transposase Helix-turn-helix domain-containing protein n=1 Tax=Dryococelus australis TaxID=614101 RepID=A0ABQ9G009_9NEOP|nr:hypothetical protein PR048_033344 [Dryococelus australis]